MIIDINLYNFMVMAACRLSLFIKIADYLCKLHYYLSIDDM